MHGTIWLKQSVALAGVSTLVLSGVLQAPGAEAADVFVDGQIAVATCAHYDPATRTCPGGDATVFRNLADALAVVGPGTTVFIRAGTYTERLAPARSGEPDLPIVFKGYALEVVNLTASPAILLTDRNHIVIEGVRVADTTWLEARNAHYNVVTNCVFLRTPASGTTGNLRFIQSHFNRIVNNHIESGNDNLLLIDSDHNLVQGNTILEARHSIFGIRCGDFNVVRSNCLSNTQQKIGEVYDCGVDTSAVPHSFNSTRRNLIEGNTFADASSYYSTSGGNGIQYAGQEGIIRRNVFYHCNVGLGMQVYGDEALYNVTNRIYHNVFYDNDGPGISPRSGNTNNVYLNNILWRNQGCIGNCDAGVSAGQIVYRRSLGEASWFENNVLLDQQPGQAVIEEEFGAGVTVSQYTNAHPGVLVGTLEVEPLFVDATNFNFHLQAGSPMIDAGAFLTRTMSAGQGTHLPVADATWCFDGFGIPGELGDEIQLEGDPRTSRVARIDYGNKTLILESSLNWTNGQRVALRYGGSAPDVGAFEWGGVSLQFETDGQEGRIQFSWPGGAMGYRLQETPSLPAVDWLDGPPAELVDDRWQVAVMPAGSTCFYRLVR